MALHQWSPVTQLARLDHDFEDILNHFMSHDWGVAKPYSRSHHRPAIESFVVADRLVVRADLPGVDPKDVEISLEGSLLTIRGLRAAASEAEQRDFVDREIQYGRFERAISIPKGVKQEDIGAAYCNGVLELTIPLTHGIEVRRVPLQISKPRGQPERPQ